MQESAPVLVISPHPDDMESGCGGTVARWCAEGRTTVLVVCTNGDKGTNCRDMSPADLAEIREREQLEAAETLGVKEVVFLRHPDQGLEDTSEFREQLVRQIRLHRPKTVLCMDPNRPYIRHRDHYISGRVALDAVFPYSRDHLAFPNHLDEGIEPHKVEEVYLWGSDEPDTFLDVTDYFELRTSALYAHTSQIREFTEERRNRSKERFEAIGKKIGVHYAEQFRRIDIFR